MKIAIVFGKGLDGCGVEKYGYEWKRYDPDNIDIFNLVERSFVRSGGHIKESISFLVYEEASGIEIPIIDSLLSKTSKPLFLNT